MVGVLMEIFRSPMLEDSFQRLGDDLKILNVFLVNNVFATLGRRV